MCFAQQIAAEIAGGVSPDGVEVVHVVLRVVVLDEEGRALEAVVVRAAALCLAGPGEVHAVGAGVCDPLSLDAVPAAREGARRRRRSARRAACAGRRPSPRPARRAGASARSASASRCSAGMAFASATMLASRGGASISPGSTLSGTTGAFMSTKSGGAISEMMACRRRSSSSEPRSSRAASSSSAHGRSTIEWPCGTSAGCAPMNSGVGETISPPARVKFRTT